MSDDATEVRRLLAVFRDRPLSVDPERIELRRRRVVPALREHVNTVAFERRRAWQYKMGTFGVLGTLAAAAAIAVFGFGVQPGRSWQAEVSTSASDPLQIRMLEGRLLHRESGIERTIVAGQSLTMPVAGEFHTPQGASARLQASSGMALDISGASRVSLSGIDPAASQRHVTLFEGKLDCSIPKLESGRRFAVVTPNARAVVHGTEFSVEVDTPEEGVTRTCVRVESGVVVVHHVAGQIELGAGKTWGCDPLADGISAGRAGDEQAHVPGRIFGSRGAAPQRGRTSEGTVRGTLAEETRLLQTALAAERSGETTLAGERLRTLLRRFPDSPLAPDARQALGRVASRESREP